MKQIFTLFSFLCMAHIAAQKWALPTSVWRITHAHTFPPSEWIEEKKVMGDTLLAGEWCKVVKSSSFPAHAPLFTFERNDTVFAYLNGQFLPVMYFHVHVGDTMLLFDYYGAVAHGFDQPNFTDSVWGKIIHIDSINVGSKYLKQFYFDVISPSYIYPKGSSYRYVENIGGDDIVPVFMYNFEADPILHSVCNYGDESIDGFYVFNTLCSPLSVEEKEMNFTIFPNPASEALYLNVTTNNAVFYQIHDVSGKILLQQEWNGTAIPISALESGVYLVTLRTQNSFLGTQKFIK